MASVCSDLADSEGSLPGSWALGPCSEREECHRAETALLTTSSGERGASSDLRGEARDTPRQNPNRDQHKG